MADLMRAMSSTLLTAEDLWNLPDDGLPHELVRGVLHRVTGASGAHGSVCTRLTSALGGHVLPRNLGEIFDSATGFLLERNPDTVRCPDVAFVARERLPAGGLLVEQGFLELAPDLAVEVVSKSNRPATVRAKVADYLRLGVRSVWVIDPRKRTVRVHGAAGAGDPAGRETLLGEHDQLQGGDVVPGFSCPIASLFIGLRR
jgi:Uma2 family endonuclease